MAKNESNKKTPVSFTRPGDKSFEAYKEWILRLTERLGAEKILSDEELRAGWERFWSKAKGKKTEEK
jgi:hypothetical protein